METLLYCLVKCRGKSDFSPSFTRFFVYFLNIYLLAPILYKCSPFFIFFSRETFSNGPHPLTTFPWHPICISNKGKAPTQVLQSPAGSPLFQAPLVSRSPDLPSWMYPSLPPPTQLSPSPWPCWALPMLCPLPQGFPFSLLLALSDLLVLSCMATFLRMSSGCPDQL